MTAAGAVRSVRVWGLVSVPQLVVFGSLAVLRTVDADEGFYALASRLVMQGRLPYVDFMYTQMPLLPYVYGVWMQVFGFNWYSGRLLSAILATLLGALIYAFALRAFNNPWLAWLGLLLYVTSAFALAFTTVVMTYPLSMLLLFAAFFAIEPWPEHQTGQRLVLSGMLLAMAIDTRLLLAAAIPAFLLGILLRCRPVARAWPRLIQWLAGLIIGLLPAVAFAALDLNAFVFGNLGFHGLRNGIGLIANWAQKLAIIAELLNIRSAGGEAITFQVPFLFALNLLYVVLLTRRLVPATIAVFATALIAVALLLPTPTYSQYFVVLLPFVIVNALYAIDRLWRDAQLTSPLMASHARAVAGAVLAVYALIVPVVLYRYVSWLGPMLPGVQQINPRDWSLPAIRNVSVAIDRLSPDQEVLAVWPGYVFESRATTVPGMENHGWLEIGAPSMPGRTPIASTASVQAAIGRHEPRLIVLGILTPDGYRESALASGYRLVENVSGVDLLQSPAP